MSYRPPLNSDNRETGKLDEAEKYFFGEIQDLLASSRKKKKSKFSPSGVKKICGVDASYSSEDNSVTAAAALLSLGCNVIESYAYRGYFTIPYVSGLFFLHEGPFALAAVKGLKQKPDLLCFDAHGLAHPRHLGLATICGMMLEIPSVGIAKSRLVGETMPYSANLEKIVLKGREVGFVSKYEGAKKYWSPGYAVSLRELEEIISKFSEVCFKSISEADRISRSKLKSH